MMPTLQQCLAANLLTMTVLAQALPYPNPRDQNCAPGYRSSGDYCAPYPPTPVG